MNVLPYHVNRLSRWEIFQLLFDILAFAEEYSDDMPAPYTAKLQTLRTTFDIYDMEVAKERRISSEELLKADKARDFAIRKIYTLIRAYSDYHFDPEKMKAAKYLMQIIKWYGTGTSISRMSQDAQTAVITNLLQDLAKSPSQGHVATLQMTDVVEALTTQNLIFKQEQMMRRKAKSEYVTDVVKNARTNLQNDFLAFVDVVNALSLIEGEEKYAELKQNISAMVKKYFALARQRTRKREEES